MGLIDQGLTKIEGHQGSLVEDLSQLRIMGFGLAVTQDDFLLRDGGLTLAVSSPLRVEGGQVSLNLPTGRDYVRDQILYSFTELSLVPSAREFDFELSYRWAPMPYTELEFNFLHQLNAGHSRINGDATSVLLGFRRLF